MPHSDPIAARTYFRERARSIRATAEGRAAQNERARKWHRTHRDDRLAAHDPIQHRVWRIQREYKITLVTWLALFKFQGERCAICRTSEPGTTKGWHTDHDHSTGVVRGILCKGCNTMLGLLGDHGHRVLQRTDIVKGYVRAAR